MWFSARRQMCRMACGSRRTSRASLDRSAGSSTLAYYKRRRSSKYRCDRGRRATLDAPHHAAGADHRTYRRLQAVDDRDACGTPAAHRLQESPRRQCGSHARGGMIVSPVEEQLNEKPLYAEDRTNDDDRRGHIFGGQPKSKVAITSRGSERV